MAATTHSTTGIPYAIIYSRADRDYAITVDGQYIGSAATYHDAEERVREYFYDLISSGALYTATELDGGSSVEEIVADAPLPTVTVTPWQGEAGAAYTDFTVGNGLTKVLLGTHSGDKSGVELVVGGACINERSDEVLPLDDVRQLRDNLTALLNDTRVLAAVESAPQAPQPPTPAAPAVALIDHGDDWIEYRAGRTALSVEDGVPACVLAFETSHDLNPARRQDVRDLYTLLSDTRVQAWLRQPEAPQQLQRAAAMAAPPCTGAKAA